MDAWDFDMFVLQDTSNNTPSKCCLPPGHGRVGLGHLRAARHQQQHPHPKSLSPLRTWMRGTSTSLCCRTPATTPPSSACPTSSSTAMAYYTNLRWLLWLVNKVFIQERPHAVTFARIVNPLLVNIKRKEMWSIGISLRQQQRLR